jgi:tetratricopeptide (TPR) repeat protein
MKRLTLILILALAAGNAPCEQRDRKREDPQERAARRQRERLAELSRQLARRLATPQPSETRAFLHKEAAALLERARQASPDQYRFDRLCRAADALLEASENILDSVQPEKKPEPDDQEEAARRLERSYFRLQQGDYFAHLSGANDAAAYLKHARSLYQQARSAYDSKQYRKAEKLGEAAAEIIVALESLAQATVRVPEPPRLK